MRAADRVNAVLALLLELLLLVSGVAIGLLLPAPLPVRIAVAVVLPVAVLVAWRVWLAPESIRRLRANGRLLLQAVLFAGAVVLLAALGAVLPALVLAVLAALRLLLGARTGGV